MLLYYALQRRFASRRKGSWLDRTQRAWEFAALPEHHRELETESGAVQRLTVGGRRPAPHNTAGTRSIWPRASPAPRA